MPSLFPYKYRQNQKEIVELFKKTLITQKHTLLEAGTGVGKTICAMVPALEFAIEHKKKVLYLTRTNSQQHQVIQELRSISRIHKVFGIALQGRRNMCPLTKSNKVFAESTPDELSRLCSDKKRLTANEMVQGKISSDSCEYYANICTTETEGIKKRIKEELLTAEEVISYCEGEKICPYELNKLLIGEAVLVVAPYVYFFDPSIRRNLLEWTNCNIDDVILIIDEAHNLPEYARKLSSVELSCKTLELAKKEAEEFGDSVVAENVKLSDFCTQLTGIIRVLSNEYVQEEDSLVPPNEVDAELMHRFTTTSSELQKLSKNLVIYGEVVRETKRKNRKLPRSYVYAVGNFLSFWMNADVETYVKLVKDAENPTLEIFCLDPSIITKIINKCYASFHISGTLSPLEEYRDSVGLPQTTSLARYPSHFPVENRTVFYDIRLTTRYEDITRDAQFIIGLEEEIVRIANNFEKNTVLFFPSFNLMRRFILDGIVSRINRSVYIEQQGMEQGELMLAVEKFKSTKNSVFFSVVGGRISEGLDFPAEQLEIVVIIGIPYPKPTARQRALEYYYDMRFGKGWEYTVKAPTTRKVLQCIGRLIRSETDRGVAIILDKRAIRFKEYITDIKPTDGVVNDTKRFFESG